MNSEESFDRDRDLSTRVNAARLPEYIGRHVRLACKVLKLNGDRATVEASDGGQVNVKLSAAANIVDSYVEVVGRVVDATTVQMHVCINLGDNLDMKLVNDTIELIHDPRFYSKMFC
ncbi:replication factor A protein 3 [Phlegmacium glaucopus]|nr:replication factor A protein 3 [Phlegmacium glaucopus]